MRALHRKLTRDLRRSWPQVVSIGAVVACGVMAALSFRSTLAVVRQARESYYDTHRFAHVFASAERVPLPVARRIAALPGVAAVEPRIVLQATLDVPRLPEPATGHVVSIPDRRERMLNDLYISEGGYVTEGALDECLVSEHFADLNGLRVSDTIGAVLNGRWQRLRIAGIATSPEFVFEMGGGGIFVDNRRFGVLWMSRGALERAAGLDGAFNDLSIRLRPGVVVPAVIADVDRLLEPYGGRGAYDREQQASNQVIADELNQLRVIGNVFPLFFLATAAFLLNVVLSRQIDMQRDELAALKAFGYSNRAVGLHYLGFAAVAVALGSVLGVAGGWWLGGEYTALYSDAFRFPTLRHRVDWVAAAVAIAVTGFAAFGGALGAVGRAVRIPPAEALRPPSPAKYRPLLLERLGLAGRIAPSVRMVLRTLERRPLRTAGAMLGVGLAGALMVSGLAPWDSVTRLMNVQFERVQREDVTVAFTHVRSDAAIEELRALRGVLIAEPFRVASVHARHGAHVRRTQLLGLDHDGTLRQFLDADGRRYRLPASGAVLSRGLARALEAERGDTIVVELTELGGEERRLSVAAVLEEMVGSGVYIDRGVLNALLREGNAASGAYLTVDPAAEAALYARFKRIPGIAGFSSRQAMLDHFRASMAESIGVSVGIIVFAACVIAAGVIYNQARIALSERGRELATLRVLGFSSREVKGMLLGEQAAVTIGGIPLSFAIGGVLAALLMKMFEAERHRFPLVIDASTYAIAAGVVLIAAGLAALAVRRRVTRLDLIAVLKTRE